MYHILNSLSNSKITDFVSHQAIMTKCATRSILNSKSQNRQSRNSKSCTLRITFYSHLINPTHYRIGPNIPLQYCKDKPTINKED